MITKPAAENGKKTEARGRPVPLIDGQDVAGVWLRVEVELGWDSERLGRHQQAATDSVQPSVADGGQVCHGESHGAARSASGVQRGALSE